MSSDLTARDVIARALDPDREGGDWGEDSADHVLAALAAAGWRLERDALTQQEPR